LQQQQFAICGLGFERSGYVDPCRVVVVRGELGLGLGLAFGGTVGTAGQRQQASEENCLVHEYHA
jgi:hypothetical protein